MNFLEQKTDVFVYNIAMIDRNVFIIKSNGTKEQFNQSKLLDSLIKAGASSEVREKISNHIAREIEDGMSTTAIYRHAFELLHKFERPVAARYSLKRAVADLGPSRFPLAKFVAEIFLSKIF